MLLKDYIGRHPETESIIKSVEDLNIKSNFFHEVNFILEEARMIFNQRILPNSGLPIVGLAKSFCRTQPLMVVLGYIFAAEFIIFLARPYKGQILLSHEMMAGPESTRGADVLLHSAALIIKQIESRS